MQAEISFFEAVLVPNRAGAADTAAFDERAIRFALSAKKLFIFFTRAIRGGISRAIRTNAFCGIFFCIVNFCHSYASSFHNQLANHALLAMRRKVAIILESPGFVGDKHYGIALSRLQDLCPRVELVHNPVVHALG